MKTLDSLMQSITDMAEVIPQSSSHLDLLLYSPCPVKLAVKERIDSISSSCESQGSPVEVHIPMGCTSVDPFDPLYKETDPDRLPGIIASIGFGDFFRRTFVEQFVDSQTFEAVLPKSISPMHVDAGIIDPRGQYVVYGLTPYIFMIDTRRLDNLPIPTCWEDLLDPCYRGQINMCGDGDDMADAVLINMYKEFGMDGIKRFGANVQGLMHSSSMAKSGGAPKAGGIYIIPYFFAETTQQPDHMQVVWPSDGAAVSPLYFLVKQEERERLQPVVDFFIHDFGQIESAQWFLPLGGPLPPTLAKDAKLKWVGWDFITSRDIAALRDELNYTFRALVRQVSA